MEEFDVAPPVICCVFSYGTRKKVQVLLLLANFVTSFSVLGISSTGYGLSLSPVFILRDLERHFPREGVSERGWPQPASYLIHEQFWGFGKL